MREVQLRVVVHKYRELVLVRAHAGPRAALTADAG